MSTSIKQPKNRAVKSSKLEDEHTSDAEEQPVEQQKQGKQKKDMKKVYIPILEPQKNIPGTKEDTVFTKITAEQIGISVTQHGSIKLRWFNYNGSKRNLYPKDFISSNLPHDIDDTKKSTLMDKLIARVKAVRETETITSDLKKSTVKILESLKGEDGIVTFGKICFVQSKKPSSEAKKRKGGELDDEPSEKPSKKPMNVKTTITKRFQDGFNLVKEGFDKLSDELPLGEYVTYWKDGIKNI